MSKTLAVDMESHVERASGAAQRRRERRLRAWQRHVRTAVQLALAEKLHHSACRTHLRGKEWMEQDAALRGQTARARGLEMESFPHCPLRGLRPPSPSGELPSLATPLLAANETLDSAALSFLLNRALEEKEKEEEERVKREEEQVKRQEDQEEALLTRLQAERDALLVLGLEALSSQQKRRLNTVLDEREAILDRWERRRVVAKAKEEKRRKKKRKKKKLPKVSSHSSCGRARRRQRQYAGHFFPCVSLRHGGRCPCCAGRAGTQVQFLNKCFVPVWLFHRRSSWTGLWYLRRHHHPYRGAEAFPYGPSVLQTTGCPQCKLCRRPARSHRCCSWTRLRRPLLYHNRCLGYDSAENCGGAAVAVRRFWTRSSTSLSWCRDRFPWSCSGS